MYSRGGISFLPEHHTSASLPAVFDLDQNAPTEMSAALPIPFHGRILALAFVVAEVTAYTTLSAILAIHINDVEVGTVTIPTGIALNAHRCIAVVPNATNPPNFKPGDILKVEIKQRPTGGTVTGQIGIVQIGAVIDQV
jgi:hypothetical protein